MSKKKESSVKQSDKQILWIRAGARCQLPPCNKYLLEDELTGYEVKMADVAHIVGRKDSKKSPRGEHPLPIEKRNEPENLMLLCSSCHNKIIDGEPKEEFSVELLTEYKKSHEDRIRFLTSLTEEHETTIIRLEGRIRGESVNITKEEVRKAVLENFKYPRYYSCEDGICIDLKSISEEIDGYWQTAVEVINDVIQNQMMPAVNKGYIKHLSVFGFSRIPLLIQLGRSLGNKVTTDIYQKSRETQEWQWPSPESNVNFESKTIQKGDNNKVAILLSISGEVMGMQDKHPVEMDKSYTIYEIRPVEEKPHLAIIKSLSTLNNFAKTYRKLQRHIESEHNAKEIMLLPATPLAVSVICGREFLRDVSSSLRVYELQREGYRYTITI